MRQFGYGNRQHIISSFTQLTAEGALKRIVSAWWSDNAWNEIRGKVTLQRGTEVKKREYLMKKLTVQGTGRR